MKTSFLTFLSAVFLLCNSTPVFSAENTQKTSKSPSKLNLVDNDKNFKTGHPLLNTQINDTQDDRTNAKLNNKPERKSDSEIIFKNNAFILVPIGIVGFAQWNWGDPKNFHTKNENLFDKDTRYGGADKVGHFYSSYLISDLLAKKFAADGIEMKKASLYGSASSIALTTIIELGDGTANEHGFSFEDQLMNTVGALSSYFLLNNPSIDRKFDFKIDYKPTSNPFASCGRLLDDYDGMRYIASLKLSGFDFAKNNFWRFIEIQTSYRTRGYVKREDEKSREIGVAIALNVGEVIDYFTKKQTNKYVSGFFEYYQPRYTYVGYDKNLNR